VFRRRRGRPSKQLNKKLARRVAGFLDSEGWIGIRRNEGTAHAAIHFGNTDQFVVRMIQKVVGTGAIAYRAPKKATHAPSWHWRCQADAAHGLLEQAYPYLRTKKRQAKLAMYVQERLAIPASRIDRQWQAEAIEASHRLNIKGNVKVPTKIRLASGRVLI
jgi:hypothetical protein